MAPEVIFESHIASPACVCESLESTGYTRAFSSAAGRGVVQVAAHERCVLVQCTIHKNLHFKNSTTRLFQQFDSWSWRLK